MKCLGTRTIATLSVFSQCLVAGKAQPFNGRTSPLVQAQGWFRIMEMR